jgi:hypothetical protein
MIYSDEAIIILLHKNNSSVNVNDKNDHYTEYNEKIYVKGRVDWNFVLY